MSEITPSLKPIHRILKGFMLLLGGDISTGPAAQPADYLTRVIRLEPRHEQTAFNRFQRAVARIKKSAEFQSPKLGNGALGKYMGREIIGEATQINGGVYLSPLPHEALVVDDKHGCLERIYHELVVRLSDLSIERTLDESEILPQVAAIALRNLKFSQRAVDRICIREGLQADEKVALDLFLHEKVGVARHQVLTVAYLIERLRKRNLLNGFARIDSESNHRLGLDERLIYTSPQGGNFVFDPLRLAGR
jgi:hypothetical protein